MVRIKICGITTTDDARMCEAAGADALGLNFYSQSPRYLNPRNSRAILQAVSPLMSVVGVFVDTPVHQMTGIAFQLGLRGVQLHGEHTEPADTFPFGFIPAFRVRDDSHVTQIRFFLDKCQSASQMPSAVLIDGYREGLHGGTGQTAPWQLLENLRLPVPLILAGGLTPDNVGQAIRQVRPFAVDVASGVESAPGIKDRYLVERFIQAVRKAES